MDLVSKGLRAQLGPKAGRGDGPEAPLKRKRDFVRPAKILLHEPGDLSIRLQTGQDIDKAKETDLKRFVLHGPVEQGLRPPGRIKDRW